MNNQKHLPKFKTENEEFDFWANNSFTDYAHDFKQVKLDLSNLKRSTRSITFRLTESMFRDLKIAANKHDVPYQSLLKMYLAQKLKDELGTKL